MSDKYITMKEACIITGKTRQTIAKWIKDGLITAEKFPNAKNGRLYILESDIPAYLRKNYENFRH